MNNSRSDMVMIRNVEINNIEDVINLMPEVLGPILNEGHALENLSCVLMVAREHKPGDDTHERERIMYNMKNNEADMERFKNDLVEYVALANRMRVMHNSHIRGNRRVDRVHVNLYIGAEGFNTFQLNRKPVENNVEGNKEEGNNVEGNKEEGNNVEE